MWIVTAITHPMIEIYITTDNKSKYINEIYVSLVICSHTHNGCKRIGHLCFMIILSMLNFQTY